MQPYANYVQSARIAGCPDDQIRNFLSARTILQPRQLQAAAVARACDRPDGPIELGYGGARGGGKSHWLLAQIAVDDCQRYPGLKCLLLRKVGKANKEGFEDLRRRVLRPLPHKYNRQEAVLTFANGSLIVLGHFQNESDIDAYLGLEYDVIGVEEATTLSAAKYRAIQTCCRTSKPDWRPRIYSTTNPGGLGHAWYKARYVDPTIPQTQTPSDQQQPATSNQQPTTHFIPATIDDNRFINAEYRGILDRLTGWQKRAWRYGDWDIAAGQFFTTWRRDIHVRQSIDAPRGWRFWCALDHGFTHYTCVHLLAKDSDGVLYILDEHCQRRWLTERHADGIKAMLARHGLALRNLYTFVAGSDGFATQMEGGSIAGAYQKHGIRLTAANDNRINGAARFLSRLGDLDATGHKVPAPIQPTLYIHARCARLIETIPTLQHDPQRPEDILKIDCDDDGQGGDDTYDSARYGIMVPDTIPDRILYEPNFGRGKPRP